ncbi:MAG TPA: hypothetical protein VN408_06915 [Actinoplanes sp.]|nr:hypothetical protein [Actinoplanes sp.]
MKNTEMSELALTVIAASCAQGTCPTVYETNRGTVMVQGYTVSAEAARAAGVDMPEGEQMVEIPLALIDQLARRS